MEYRKIKGRLTEDGNTEFWNGYILLDEDAYFEGIVNHVDKDDVETFIYGVYHPKKILQLRMVSSELKYEQYVHMAEWFDNGYRGELYGINDVGLCLLGDNKIIVKKEEKNKNMEIQINELLDKISIFKENENMGEYYNYLNEYRFYLTNALLKTHNKEVFSNSEINNILTRQRTNHE